MNYPVARRRCRGLKGYYRGLGEFVFILTACCLLSPTVPAAPVKEIRRVLLLHSLGFSSPASLLVDREIRAALGNAPYQIELYAESMQGILFSDPVSQREVREGYIHRYRMRRPDVVIAIGPGPIMFMDEANDEFGPNIPVVICASTEDQVNARKLDP